MVFSLGGIGEAAKRQLRDIRTAAMNSCTAAIKDIDMKRQFEAATHKLFESNVKKIEDLIASKQKELKS